MENKAYKLEMLSIVLLVIFFLNIIFDSFGLAIIVLAMATSTGIISLIKGIKKRKILKIIINIILITITILMIILIINKISV